MKHLFIPTDRIGLYNFQKSICQMTQVINQLLYNGFSIRWHWKKHFFSSTPLWPEGHQYQCGFSMDFSDDIRHILELSEIRFECVTELPPDSLTLRPAKIALYNGSGAGPEFSAPLTEVLGWGGFQFDAISDEEIRAGKLMNYDIFLVPGSPDAGECYYVGLGEMGLEEIRRFLREKGQYMGICGGAYLPLYSESPENRCWLNLVDATEDQDLDFWHTGSGLVRCRIDEPEHPLFSGIAVGKTTSMNLVYWEGPCIHITGSNTRSLGHFEKLLANGFEKRPFWDMYDNSMAKEATLNYYNSVTDDIFNSLMKEKSCFAEGDCYGHKILMFSPHPEMGNVGCGPRKDSLNFLLIYNGLFYLGAQHL